MYGLVNRAIEQLVVSVRGEPGWMRVCARANVSPDGFVAMCPYHDDVTYRLVEAASIELDQPVDQVLEAFGEYWILYTAEEGYGSLLEAAGTDLRSFLQGLNDLHGRVENLFPHMQLPHFKVVDVGAGEYRLHYRSSRTGLAPMVMGLLRGLAIRFEQTVVLERLPADALSADAVFRVVERIEVTV
jgi:hypothetical protein